VADDIVVALTHEGDPPSKARARFNGRGSKARAFTPERTRAGEEALGWAVKAAKPGLRPDPDGSFEVNVAFYTATWQRRDLDNMVKLVLDACNGVVWEDDAQVTAIHARVNRADPRPRTDLVICRDVLQAPPGVKCRRCGGWIRTYPSWRERRYCSKPCSDEAQRDRRSHTCRMCGSTFERPAHQRPKFCSPACRGAWQKGRPRGART
jgi:Holliday junction resolvase RusA-like endonuclease